MEQQHAVKNVAPRQKDIEIKSYLPLVAGLLADLLCQDLRNDKLTH